MHHPTVLQDHDHDDDLYDDHEDELHDSDDVSSQRIAPFEHLPE